MRLTALTWNLYHGRDHPPDPGLRTWRSRLLRRTERGDTHAQVNRDLREEFAAVLAAAEWDLALLQEVPPRWASALAAGCDADAHRTLTSRNSVGALRTLAARLNPDLIGSNEGGSNLILVRRRAGAIVARRELELRGRGRLERRTLAFVRVRPAAQPAGELCVANLHASAGTANRGRAEEEVRLAAERCAQWARGTPLILGGDFNLRPRQSAIYAELERGHGLGAPTAPDAIDHLLAAGLEIVRAPRLWPPEAREIRDGELAIRLSDHAPVDAVLALRPGQRASGAGVG